MTLHDISNGPSWIIWVVFVLFLIMTIAFLSGRGSALIAGFNTMSDAEKSQYNIKKMCRGMGVCFAIIDVVILVMLLGENVLPSWTVYVAVGVILVDVISVIIFGNFFCRKK